MEAEELFHDYQELIMEMPEEYYADCLKALEKVKNSSARYHGHPVEFLYQPMFFAREDIRRFDELSRKLTIILKKIIAEYRSNPAFRQHFPFSDLLEELILVDPGYQVEFPVARFDIFYHYDGQAQFCELNADGSSGMNEARVLQEVIGEARAFQPFIEDYQVDSHEYFRSWLREMLKNYKEYNGGRDDHPNIAIVDFTGEGTVSEFEQFQRCFQEEGYQTVICDPREMEYVEGSLFYQGLKVKLIYRRATTARLVEMADEIADFLAAYRDGAVCVVGGLVSQLIHNKFLFALLHDRNKLPFLSEEEHQFISKHIPYTEIFDPDNKQQGERLLREKDWLVLKPFDKFASHGVYIGRDFTPKEWQMKIAEAAGEDYLVQEFCSVPAQKMLTAAEGKLFFEDYHYIIGLFMFNQRLSGLYTRVSRANIIGSIVECYTVPNFVIKEK
ncbi:MAG: hypothetical protein UMV23_02845 [Halanaerobium sp.]|nr:hypothetical protein [Halanaerobium sp.]